MQKQYTVQSPDGRTITIEGPDGASEDEVIRQAQQLMAGDTAATQQFNPPLVPQFQPDMQESRLGRVKSLIDTAGGYMPSGTTAARTVGGVLGGIGGSAFGPAGTVIGATGGAMAGDMAAQMGERLMGTRPSLSAGQQVEAGIEGAIGGAIPGVAKFHGEHPIRQAISSKRIAQFGTPKVQAIEKAIAPTSRETQASTMKIAPELARDPKLVSAKGIRFDQRLVEKFNEAEAMVDAAQRSVPRGTNVPQTPITTKLETIIEKYRDMGADDAAAAVAKEWEKWASQPAQIPWEDFVKRKRAFGDAMRTMGRFRETGTAAEKATGAAMREAYGQLMEIESQISPQLKSANHAYSIAHQAADNAGINLATGRRYSSVGKVPATRLQRVKALAKKGAIMGATGAGGAAVYEALR